MEKIILKQGDCLEVMKVIPNDFIDLIVSDPPYGISFMAEEWDTFNEISSPQGAYEKEKGFKKLPRNSSAGMYDFFLPRWKEALRVMKPGAFAFVMVAPRQDVLNKQIQALSDAGFDMGFTSIYWSFSSGFPKASNIGKKHDKKEGNEREVVGRNPNSRENCDKDNTLYESGTVGKTAFITKGESEFEGSYAGFQPKPAVEVVLVAMKPIDEKTYYEQAIKNNKGITWLDDCRIPYENEKDKATHHNNAKGMERLTKDFGDKLGSFDGGWEKINPDLNNDGRFPANLLVSDDTLNDGKDHIGCSGQNHKTEFNPYGGTSLNKSTTSRKGKLKGYDVHGSYSRYFDLDKWFEKRLEKMPKEVQITFPFLLSPKASKKEKNKGCDELDNRQVCRTNNAGEFKNIDRPVGNNHPTVKPIKLMSYLVTLGSRENDFVLDPFLGSGTTAIACKLLNRKCLGIELSNDYLKIAKARLKGNE